MDERPDTQSFSIFFSNWAFPKSKAHRGYTFCFVQLSPKEKKTESRSAHFLFWLLRKTIGAAFDNVQSGPIGL